MSYVTMHFEIIIIIVLLLCLLLMTIEFMYDKNCTISTDIAITTSIPTSTDRMSDESALTKPYMWVYWERVNGAEIPPYISLCMDIMRKNGSIFFNVVFLDEKTVFHYIPDLRKDINDLPIALKTDYIRVKLLYMYGGLWVDADTILMSNLQDISEKLNSGTVDFVGFGCTGAICKDQEGYGRPSNGVMGSVKGGRLIKRCLDALNKKLDVYYSVEKDKRKDFDYFDLGKKIIWTEYDKLVKEDPTYKVKMYHVPSYLDGTRDKDGHWVAKILIFKKDINYSHRDELLVVMLSNLTYCGSDSSYNWFCSLPREQILNGNYFISGLFKDAIKYNPYSKN